MLPIIRVITFGLATFTAFGQTTADPTNQNSTQGSQPKKQSIFGVMRDAAKSGARTAVKNHPIEVNTCEVDRSLNDLAEEAGKKSVESPAQRKTAGGIKPAPCKTTSTAGASGGAARTPKIGDTELAGLFSKFPRREDPRTRANVGWPRVALTLLQAPKWH